MTEVPDHLLQRSRERRAALGLGGGDAGGDAAPATATPATTEATSAAPAKAAAKAAPVPSAPKPPPFIPPYVQASQRRNRVPVWVMPVVAFLPIWGVLYAQSLSKPPATGPTQLASGAVTYQKCAGCHGATGGGGSGRPLSGGEVLLTFPNIANQLEYVRLGDAGFGNKPYGNPGREGGQHNGLTGYNGAFMPTQADLKDADLLSVIRHERETISGEKDVKVNAAGNRLWPDDKPMLDSAGKLVWSDGTPMFDANGHLTKTVDPSKPAE